MFSASYYPSTAAAAAAVVVHDYSVKYIAPPSSAQLRLSWLHEVAILYSRFKYESTLYALTFEKNCTPKTTILSGENCKRIFSARILVTVGVSAKVK